MSVAPARCVRAAGAWSATRNEWLRPSMRRPIPVQEFFLVFPYFGLFFPFSQAASVATLPSALLCERFSLGASGVFSMQ